MSKRLIVLFAGVLALAGVAAGCGGSGDGDSTAAPLTKAEFIKQGDAICKSGETKIEGEAEEFAEENDVDTEKPTKEQQEEVIVDVVAPGIRQQAEDIGDLGAPSGDEAEIEAIVEAVETGADELETEPAKLLEGENPLQKGSKLAKEYGFTECGE